MPFTDHKLETFTKKISDLPDEPKLLPNELKACFDSSPEELRQAHNDLCTSLDEIQANMVHFTMTAGVPEENVQDAIENVQEQLTAAIMGNIPSGSVTQDKLAQDVRDRFSAIETAAATEASTRASADSNLQSQINTHTSQINSLSGGKCEIYCGTYTGDGTEQREISLGFSPKAVLVLYAGYQMGGVEVTGGLALAGVPLSTVNSNCVEVTNTGFKVFAVSYAATNTVNQKYVYLAFKQA